MSDTTTPLVRADQPIPTAHQVWTRTLSPLLTARRRALTSAAVPPSRDALLQAGALLLACLERDVLLYNRSRRESQSQSLNLESDKPSATPAPEVPELLDTLAELRESVHKVGNIAEELSAELDKAESLQDPARLAELVQELREAISDSVAKAKITTTTTPERATPTPEQIRAVTASALRLVTPHPERYPHTPLEDALAYQATVAAALADKAEQVVLQAPEVRDGRNFPTRPAGPELLAQARQRAAANASARAHADTARERSRPRIIW